MNKLMMTPGPTYISEEVRMAMAEEITNPDLDLEFFDFYKDTCEKIKVLLNTKNDVLILSGEGILGLEAACASLIEEGDKVLCIENGIFGYGFGDFAKIYGGDVIYFHGNRNMGLKLEDIREFLKENNDFKIATLVHCETPSGITNDISGICKLLSSYNIITVVDAVSSIGGEVLKVDSWDIDIVLGGSQKCLSAAPGLTFLSISNKAKEVIKSRRTPIRAFYANLSIWDNWYENKWFPYTQPISDIYGLRVAIDKLLNDSNRINRHKELATAFRSWIVKSGLELFSEDSYSNTVSTIMIPEGIKFRDIFEKMKNDHGILIAGGFDFLQDKVIRVGHMGENCYGEKLILVLEALEAVLSELGVDLHGELHKMFQL